MWMAVQKGRVCTVMEKLTSGKTELILENMKKQESTMFQPSGLALKQGEKFTHSFNVKQIKCTEAKLTTVTRAERGSTTKK